MNLSILLSPPVAFLVCFALCAGIYGLGRLVEEKSVPVEGKYEPYACGESYQAEKQHFGYRKFYIAAIFFTIMHVAVLTIATVPGGTSAYRALIYLAAIAASISFLFVDFD
ncbi:MAG TPA: NADH-quinone oxidoreductase subunit A [Acidobacteriota bacterium]|nr:NADH-quinone oxidoreductase subunit A [Acidobacteriota bacterium]